MWVRESWRSISRSQEGSERPTQFILESTAMTPHRPRTDWWPVIGGVKRVNHTMTQILAMVVNERQDDRDLQLPHVEFAYNSSVSATTGLPPRDDDMGRLPRLPLTVLGCPGLAGLHRLSRNHLAYCDLPNDRQQRVNDIVRRHHHALTVSRVNHQNSALDDAMRPAVNSP